MFYRFNHIHFDPARRDQFLAKADTLRDQLATIPGLNQVNTVEIGEGQGIIFGVYESAEHAEKALDSVQTMMTSLGEYFTAPPKSHSGPAIWEWQA